MGSIQYCLQFSSVITKRIALAAIGNDFLFSFIAEKHPKPSTFAKCSAPDFLFSCTYLVYFGIVLCALLIFVWSDGLLIFCNKRLLT